jgi:hypothetical protein
MDDNANQTPAAEPRSSIAPVGTIMLPIKGELRLRVDFNALAEIEEVTGRNMMEPTAFQNLSAKTIRTILWICIRQEHAEITEAEIGKEISLGNLAYVLKTITQTWMKAMPKKEDVGKKDEPKIPLQ